jgi:hypothetical protein
LFAVSLNLAGAKEGSDIRHHFFAAGHRSLADLEIVVFGGTRLIKRLDVR